MNGLIKKTALAAGFVMLSTVMMAQSKALYLSSVTGSDVAQYDGQTRNVTMYRSIYNGWNTFCVPFDMTTEELNTAFGDACKLETLTRVSVSGDTYYLGFTDAKSDGVKADTPYLLYYTGENKSIKVEAADSKIKYDADPELTFIVAGTKLQFAGAITHLNANGQYGIYVKDNADANFSTVDNSSSGFYATRCYITVEGATTTPKLVSLHNEDVTAIANITNTATAVEGNVYNINGTRQNGLQKGVNLVKGKKVYIK